MHDTSALDAPLVFGKTVTAAAVIAQRMCPTLIIVHTTALLRQWRSQLAVFLSADVKEIDTLRGGRKRPTLGVEGRALSEG